MELRDIISSAIYLEFINKIDDLMLEILYEPNNGYMNLSSKNAIENASKYLQQFDEKAQKIKEQTDVKQSDIVISDKRNYLIEEINKHYKRQAYIWCDEIYENLVENCLSSISMDKTNKENIDKNFQRVIAAITWIANIKGLSDNEQNNLLENFNSKLDKIVKNKEDYIETKDKIKSNTKTFIDLFNLILEDEEKFLKTDLVSFSQNLSNEDLRYFKQLQTEIKGVKQNQIRDEFSFIKSAIELLNLKNNDEKYSFIKNIENDFSFFKIENKKILQEDKITLIQKRMKIFKDNISSNDKLNYFKNLLKVTNKN